MLLVISCQVDSFFFFNSLHLFISSFISSFIHRFMFRPMYVLAKLVTRIITRPSYISFKHIFFSHTSKNNGHVLQYPLVRLGPPPLLRSTTVLLLSSIRGFLRCLSLSAVSLSASKPAPPLFFKLSVFVVFLTILLFSVLVPGSYTQRHECRRFGHRISFGHVLLHRIFRSDLCAFDPIHFDLMLGA